MMQWSHAGPFKIQEATNCICSVISLFFHLWASANMVAMSLYINGFPAIVRKFN